MEYTNRDDKVFTFTYDKDRDIVWKGDFRGGRVGVNFRDEDEITMVDPPGGPFIDLGTDMRHYGLSGLVKGFVEIDGGYVILVEQEAIPDSVEPEPDVKVEPVLEERERCLGLVAARIRRLEEVLAGYHAHHRNRSRLLAAIENLRIVEGWMAAGFQPSDTVEWNPGGAI